MLTRRGMQGVGMKIQRTPEGTLEVQELAPDGPAAQAGLQVTMRTIVTAVIVSRHTSRELCEALRGHIP
jgi:C-terminal processing protease CtpA/Prc